MQNLVKYTLYTFLCITALTAFLALLGIYYTWFSPEHKKLPYLCSLVTLVVIEIASVILILARKGMKYLPDTKIDKEPEDTLKFMEKFISTGTSATVISNRISWLAGNDQLISIFQTKIKNGTRIEIITPNEVSELLRQKLQGASFVVTNETVPPEARFTLINGERSGSEKLAIARGVHPDHEITIFDNNSGPQIIAMAKDIISKSKRLSNAS